MMSKTYKVR